MEKIRKALNDHEVNLKLQELNARLTKIFKLEGEIQALADKHRPEIKRLKQEVKELNEIVNERAMYVDDVVDDRPLVKKMSTSGDSGESLSLREESDFDF